MARSAEERRWSLRTARRSLVQSAQAWHRPGGDELDLSPALGLIAAARTHADFLVVTRTPEGTPVRAAPFGYAVADDDHGFRGLVVELRTPGWHDYRLLAIRTAAEGFVDWARRAVDSHAWGGRADVAVIEVLRLDEESPGAAAVSIRSSGSDRPASAVLLDGRRLRVGARDRDALVATVETMVEQAVARGRGTQG